MCSLVQMPVHLVLQSDIDSTQHVIDISCKILKKHEIQT